MLKIGVSIFTICIFFLRIPPFGVGMVQTHNFARFLIIFLLIISFFFIKKRSNANNFTNNLFIPLFLLIVSISSVFSLSIIDYISLYKDLVLGIMVYYFFHFYFPNTIHEKRKIYLSFFLSILFNILFNFTFYFKINPLYNFLTPQVYQKYFLLIDTNAKRGRFFIENTDFYFIPLLAPLFLNERRILMRLIYVFLMMLLLFQSILSGFRSLFIITVLSIFCSVFLIAKKRNFIYSTTFFLTPLFLTTLLANKFTFGTQNNAIERLINPKHSEIFSLKSRFNLIAHSFEIFESSPFFGIGYGNLRNFFTPTGLERNNPLFDLTYRHTHNIFFEILATTGIFGFFAFSLIIFSFLKFDISKKKFIDLKIGFWLLMFYALVNPSFTIQFQLMFWLLRGMLSIYSF